MSEKVTGKDLEKLLNEKFSIGSPPLYPDVSQKTKLQRAVGKKAVKQWITKTGAGNPSDDAAKKIARILKTADDGEINNLTKKDLVKSYRMLSTIQADKSDFKYLAAALKGLSAKGDDDGHKKLHDVNLYFALMGRKQDPRKATKFQKNKAALTKFFFDESIFDEPPTKEDVQEYLLVYDTISDPEGVLDPTDFGEPQKKQDIFDFDLRNYDSAQGKYPPSLQVVFERLVGAETNFLNRVNKITDFSESFANLRSDDNENQAYLRAQSAIQKNGFASFTQGVMALDYISSIARNLDAGSSAYQFETFLALLAGGRVTGKDPAALEGEAEEGSKSKGQMGAVDFKTTYDGKEVSGSSKFYSTFSGLSQSAKGFKQGENVIYIIGIKEGGADPQKMTAVNIYFLTIQCVRKSGDLGTFKYFGPLGNALKVDSDVEEAKFDNTLISRQALVGTIKFVDIETQTFKEVALESANAISDYYGQMLKELEEIFAETVALKNNLTDYSTSIEKKASPKATGLRAIRKIDSGYKAIENSNKIKQKTEPLVSALSDEKGWHAKQSSQVQAEQKITTEMLQKLIEENFKK